MSLDNRTGSSHSSIKRKAPQVVAQMPLKKQRVSSLVAQIPSRMSSLMALMPFLVKEKESATELLPREVIRNLCAEQECRRTDKAR